MEELPTFSSINRNGILVKPRQRLFTWLKVVDPETPFTTAPEGSIYLIREMDSNDLIEQWLQTHFEPIFKNELNSWHTIPEEWPQNRTYELFREWFDVEFHSMVFDLEEVPLHKD